MNLKRAEKPRLYVSELNGKQYTLPVQAACCYYCDLCMQTPLHHSWHCFETGEELYYYKDRIGYYCPMEWRIEDENQDTACG